METTLEWLGGVSLLLASELRKLVQLSGGLRLQAQSRAQLSRPATASAAGRFDTEVVKSDTLPVHPGEHAACGGDGEQRDDKDPLERTVVMVGIDTEDRLDPVAPDDCQQTQRGREASGDGLDLEHDAQMLDHRQPSLSACGT